MDQAELAQHLAERKRELSAELARLTEPPDETTAVAFGKRIGDGTTEAVERLSTTATARSISASLHGIERVLAKLEDGTYGRCDDCGQMIPAERLEARPITSLCVPCSQARDQRKARR